MILAEPASETKNSEALRTAVAAPVSFPRVSQCLRSPSFQEAEWHLRFDEGIPALGLTAPIALVHGTDDYALQIQGKSLTVAQNYSASPPPISIDQ